MYESRLRGGWRNGSSTSSSSTRPGGASQMGVRCHAFNYSAAGSPLLRASIGERRSILEALGLLTRIRVEAAGGQADRQVRAARARGRAARRAGRRHRRRADAQVSVARRLAEHRAVGHDARAAARVHGGDGGGRADGAARKPLRHRRGRRRGRRWRRRLASGRLLDGARPDADARVAALGHLGRAVQPFVDLRRARRRQRQCGAARGPCCVRRRAEPAPVHALPPSVRLPVYRLPPLAVPEAWRVARGDGSVLSQLPQPRTAAEPPPTRRRRSAPSRPRSTSSPARRGERRRRASRRARGTLGTTITISFGAAVVTRIRSDTSFTPLRSQLSTSAARAHLHSSETPQCRRRPRPSAPSPTTSPPKTSARRSRARAPSASSSRTPRWCSRARRARPSSSCWRARSVPALTGPSASAPSSARSRSSSAAHRRSA